jgi:hypothetical protein
MVKRVTNNNTSELFDTFNENLSRRSKYESAIADHHYGDIAGNVAKIVAASKKSRWLDRLFSPKSQRTDTRRRTGFRTPISLMPQAKPLYTIIDATSGITAVVGTIRPVDGRPPTVQFGGSHLRSPLTRLRINFCRNTMFSRP